MISKTPMNLDEILSALTLDEKISLLAGKNFWETVAIPRLDIPSLKTSDGPNGARGSTFHDGTTAACFPASVLLAASWDPELVHRIGNALAEETMTKGAKILLAPTVCPHRHPLGGRNFESFSEDPFLAGKLATQYILGLQELGVGATIKHFAANEQETRRFTMNANISQRALREIYLKPFEIAIKEAEPWAVMTSYNLINGVHSDMNKWMLSTVLREEWGWNGLVMSDWGGTNSTAESIEAGLELEMPGPTVRRKLPDVLAAMKAGTLKEESIDVRVREVLILLEKTGKFEHPETPAEQAINKPEHQALIREAGGKGITLLKNEGNILPLKEGKLGKVAVLGLAKQCLAHGGGSAAVNCHYKVTPWEALEKAIGDRAEISFAEGARVLNTLPVLGSGLTDLSGKPGLTLRKYETPDLTTEPLDTINYHTCSYTPLEQKLGGLTMSGHFTPTVTGSHHLSLSSLGPSRLYINDELVIDIKTDNSDSMSFLLGGSEGTLIRHFFTSGQPYSIRLETTAPSPSSTDFGLLEGLLGLTMGFMDSETYSADVLSSATDLAKTADLCLIFTGNTTAWETEGRDMLETKMRLPDKSHSQDKLISAATSANSNVIVINSTGVAIEMSPWIHSVKAFVQSWFPGQEAGNSIVDILTGKVNPSGKLPVSFPKRIEDTPAYGNFPGSVEELQVTYEEGVYMGYRHFDRCPETLLFPFGFGLSYTRFEFSAGKVLDSNITSEGEIRVRITVENTGDRAGAEVLQIYVAPAFETKVDMPVKKLAGFAKVDLGVGESKVVEVRIGRDGCAYWDERTERWVVEKGKWAVVVGNSSAREGEVYRGKFEVEETFSYGP